MIYVQLHQRGIIYADAVTRCGTEERLLEAATNGQVKMVGPKGRQTVFFPRYDMGKERRFESGETMQKNTAKDESAFDAYNDAIGSFVGADFGDLDATMQPMRFSFDGPEMSVMSPSFKVGVITTTSSPNAIINHIAFNQTSRKYRLRIEAFGVASITCFRRLQSLAVPQHHS
jgi:hypothetical protein